MSIPGGQGLSSPPPFPPCTTIRAVPRTCHWAHFLGLHVTVHDSHGALTTNLLATTKKVVQSRTVIDLYFSVDWCSPCL